MKVILNLTASNSPNVNKVTMAPLPKTLISGNNVYTYLY